ncbi:inactive polyglycylase TTLL10 [Discoglossus pictus]
MQIKNSLVESNQEELKQDLYKPDGPQVSLGNMSQNGPLESNGEKGIRNEKTKADVAGGAIRQDKMISTDDVSGTSVKRLLAPRKSPEDPRCQKKVLKIAPKPKMKTGNNKSASDPSTIVTVTARKKKKTQVTSQSTGSQLLPRMLKAGFESSNPEPLEETKPEASVLKQKVSSEGSPPADKKLEEPRGTGPFFYFGGGNGAQLVSAYCARKGWQRIQDSKREDYKLKWCEIKSSATYYSFREGEQLVYQIPNNKLLTTKIGLLSSLREYERVMQKINKSLNQRMLKIDDFFPETLRLDVHDERETFFSLYKEGQTWICKPTGLNQGRGIFLIKTPEEINNLRSQVQVSNNGSTYMKNPSKCPQARIVQRYIQNPLLLDGRKFDIRSYLLIASTVPYIVFFRHGYVRLTCNNYDPKSDDLTGHLTNQYMQKKNPLYSELKEETVWGMDRFNSYVNEHFAAAKKLPQDWVFNVFTKRMQQIMMHCFLAVKSKLECRLGYFDLFGCDFLIDEDFKVWLLEMNCNPALHTNCEVLKDVIPCVVNETLDLTLEIFNKTLRGQRILPLHTQRKCVLLYSGSQTDQSVKGSWPKPTSSPPRVQKTESLSELAKNGDKCPKNIKASSDNGNANERKSTISKVAQKTTLAMPPVQIVEEPNGIALNALKVKSIGEPGEEVTQNNITPESMQAKSKSDKNKTVAEMFVQDPQTFMINGSLDIPPVNIVTLDLKSKTSEISVCTECEDAKVHVPPQKS